MAKLQGDVVRGSFTVEASEADLTLAALLRRRVAGLSWSKAGALCERGQVTVDGARSLDPAARIVAGQLIDVDESRPSPAKQAQQARLVHVDVHLVILEKPAGIPAVPFERGERGTALDLAVSELRRLEPRRGRPPLFVVHRIDKETSGLIAYARTRAAERALGALFRAHDVERAYLTVAHGDVYQQRVESWLVPDRGDGLRGSGREPGKGQHAITNLRALEQLPAATLLEVRLETGRTHQIRIHLAEAGHPVVGEQVYVRDFIRAGRKQLPSTRLMLHAATLAFEHPLTSGRVSATSPPPNDFAAQLAALRRR